MAASAVTGFFRAARRTPDGCEFDNRIAAAVAEDAPRAVLKHYDADHFTVYHPPVVEKVVADQLDFLAVHLTQ